MPAANAGIFTPEHDGYIRPADDYLRNAHSLDRYSDGEHAPFISRVS